MVENFTERCFFFNAENNKRNFTKPELYFNGIIFLKVFKIIIRNCLNMLK